ncbi:MAG: DNA repair protein RadC [Bacillota bacterium]
MDELEYRTTLKDLPASERPRERLAMLGTRALTDTELVAILLGSGTRSKTALEVARCLLQGEGIRVLAQASVDELAREPGIGLAKACVLKAAAEIGRRLASSSMDRAVVRSPGDVGDLLMEDMRYLDREHFRIVMLNTKNQVLGVESVAVGSLNAAIVHPREIFKSAITRSAAAVVLVHNHPSGDPTPSQEDIQITRRLVEAGRLLGIEVLDHVVIGDNRYLSLRGTRADW